MYEVWRLEGAKRHLNGKFDEFEQAEVVVGNLMTYFGKGTRVAVKMPDGKEKIYTSKDMAPKEPEPVG